MRYFIELRYKGTNYCGWQRQNNDITIQGCIEDALSKLLRSKIEITGAGRTDAGVHASHYVAHFDHTNEAIDCQQLCYKLNVILPPDIAIKSVYPVDTELHARFSATMREYTYIIEPQKNPFSRELSWQYYVTLDIENMNRAADYLLKHNDFTSFAKLNSNNKTNICDVSYAEWHTSPKGELIFTIRADRFLRNMIRAIVGTLVDVGRGKYTHEDFNDIILSCDLSRASGSAPAQGLFLSDIKY
ncbi:MAG: tRNA pseudouridine(38-40) synthase TruA [Rikenellaceae bacterium]